jgi:hypothetical protein
LSQEAFKIFIQEALNDERSVVFETWTQWASSRFDLLDENEKFRQIQFCDQAMVGKILTKLSELIHQDN